MSKGLEELGVNEGLDEAKANHSITNHRRSLRQPLSVFSKTVIAVLLVHISLVVGLALFVQQPSLLITAGIELLLAALILIGIRWAPLLGSLLGGLYLYVFVTVSDYPLAHLSHPKDVYGPGVLPALAFLLFTVMLLMFWCPAMLVVTGIAAVIQNYSQRERRTPHWFKIALAGAIGVLCGAFILGALQQPTPATTVNASGTPTVHLYVGSFSQSSITLAKGAKLTLIDDGAYHHNISAGSWINGQPVFNQPAGEPVVKNRDIDAAGASIVIGPFTTAGTYHLLCSIHQGMTLAIIVQ